MQEIMKIGKEIVDKIGHKDYKSEDDFYEDIHNNTSPLQKIDPVTTGDNLGLGINIFAVKECALGKLMKQMLNSGDKDQNTVKSSMDHFQIRKDEEHSFIDIGCWIMQQIRQMVVSSITLNGEYVFNYVHLACKREGVLKFSEQDIAAMNIPKDKLEKVLEDHECIYAISFKESSN